MKINTPSTLTSRKTAQRLATKVRAALKQQKHKSKGIHKSSANKHNIPDSHNDDVEIENRE